MDRLTRLALKVLGWHAVLGRDGRGDTYESWVRGSSYFHVYHERRGREVVRPRARGER